MNKLWIVLLCLLSLQARADCTATTWIDDFSVAPLFADARNGAIVNSGSQLLPSGLTRTTVANSWNLSGGAPPTATTRLVVERGSSGPVICWQASDHKGDPDTGSESYCEFSYSFSGSIPLNGATKWMVVTDHIGVDGLSFVTASGISIPSSSITMLHGFASHATIWTQPLEPAMISAGAITSPIIFRWHPVAASTNMQHSRWGMLRFGLTDSTGACLPIQTPPSSGSPGPGYSALENDGQQLVLRETWAGNGRTCNTCHVTGDNSRLTLASAQRLAADPLYWSRLGETEAEIRASARVLSHALGFGQPATLTGVPKIDSLFLSATFGRGGQASLETFIDGAIRDHLSFSNSFAAPHDFREATEWELAAMAEFLTPPQPIGGVIPGDASGDCVVGASDSLLVGANYGKKCGH